MALVCSFTIQCCPIFGRFSHGLSAPCIRPFRWISKVDLRLGWCYHEYLCDYHLYLLGTTDFYRVENFLCHYIVPALVFSWHPLLLINGVQSQDLGSSLMDHLALGLYDFALFNSLVLKLQYSNSRTIPSHISFKCEDKELGRGYQMVLDHFSVYSLQASSSIWSSKSRKRQIVFLLGKLGRSL